MSSPKDLEVQNIVRDLEQKLLDSDTEQILEYHIAPDKIDELYSCIEEILGRSFKKSYIPAKSRLYLLIMPTRAHEAGIAWFARENLQMGLSGFLNEQEYDMLLVQGSVTVEGFVGGLRKEADAAFAVKRVPMHTVVLECGWTERYEDGSYNLLNDKDTWLLHGEHGSANVCFLLNFEKNDMGHIEAFFEVWRRDPANPLTTVRNERFQIFPYTQRRNTPPHEFGVKRWELFGDNVLPGRDPADVWNFSVDRLRAICEGELEGMNLARA